MGDYVGKERNTHKCSYIRTVFLIRNVRLQNEINFENFITVISFANALVFDCRQT